MKKRVRVVAALFTRGDTVLVQQRPPDKSRALLWEFPGGKVEAGEADEAALARECAEELGVSVSVGERLWSVVHEYADLAVELVLYRAAMAADAVPQPHEAHQLAWVERARLPGMEFCEADVPLLPRLAAGEFA
ncbi:(deoxy)nucleoside triphosphate pyrophosphohydrolase [Vulgatibacter sp.]|uniref:(deoxy)nucleoside triphosphate pyrophosphohydrolase n=1 Tax=Vulgatibacter sp. TaxID=1971226 RepID=UPI003567CF55